jgi:hypothetical protein
LLEVGAGVRLEQVNVPCVVNKKVESVMLKTTFNWRKHPELALVNSKELATDRLHSTRYSSDSPSGFIYRVARAVFDKNRRDGLLFPYEYAVVLSEVRIKALKGRVSNMTENVEVMLSVSSS